METFGQFPCNGCDIFSQNLYIYYFPFLQNTGVTASDSKTLSFWIEFTRYFFSQNLDLKSFMFKWSLQRVQWCGG